MTPNYIQIHWPSSSNNLHIDLDSLDKWSLDWAVEFNKFKCQVLRISRKKAKNIVH
jgi:hypothetical protein